MRLLEQYRRKAEKWLVDGIADAKIGWFDIRFKICGTKYRFKVFSIPWIITYLATIIISSYAIYWIIVIILIIGG